MCLHKVLKKDVFFRCRLNRHQNNIAALAIRLTGAAMFLSGFSGSFIIGILWNLPYI